MVLHRETLRDLGVELRLHNCSDILAALSQKKVTLLKDIGGKAEKVFAILDAVKLQPNLENVQTNVKVVSDTFLQLAEIKSVSVLDLDLSRAPEAPGLYCLYHTSYPWQANRSKNVKREAIVYSTLCPIISTIHAHVCSITMRLPQVRQLRSLLVAQLPLPKRRYKKHELYSVLLQGKITDEQRATLTTKYEFWDQNIIGLTPTSGSDHSQGDITTKAAIVRAEDLIRPHLRRLITKVVKTLGAGPLDDGKRTQSVYAPIQICLKHLIEVSSRLKDDLGKQAYNILQSIKSSM